MKRQARLPLARETIRAYDYLIAVDYDHTPLPHRYFK